jgi:hypothetical protein
MADAVHTMKVLTLPDNPCVAGALAENSLVLEALPDHAAMTNADHSVPPAVVASDTRYSAVD